MHKIRPKWVPQPKNAKCVTCGLHEPLEASHLIPQHILNRLLHPHRSFFDYDTENVVYMCNNCHGLYRLGKLKPKQRKKIERRRARVAYRLLLHITEQEGLLEGATQLREFIRLQKI